ncbi:hypothetical protein AgCh_006066 [Apium graveolens]
MGHPNYMANTESYQVKVRSQSAPRQRIDFERLASTKWFGGGYLDEEISLDRGWPLHVVDGEWYQQSLRFVAGIKIYDDGSLPEK